jgi:hypothetical protein
MNKIDLIIDALEAGLKLSDGFISEWNQINKALAAARELKAEKQEPVATRNRNGMIEVEWGKSVPIGTKLYTAPPRKEWVGLTDDEVSKVYCDWLEYIKINNDDNLRIFVLQIEAKLKEKNT